MPWAKGRGRGLCGWDVWEGRLEDGDHGDHAMGAHGVGGIYAVQGARPPVVFLFYASSLPSPPPSHLNGEQDLEQVGAAGAPLLALRPAVPRAQQRQAHLAVCRRCGGRDASDGFDLDDLRLVQGGRAERNVKRPRAQGACAGVLQAGRPQQVLATWACALHTKQSTVPRELL